MSAPDLTLLRPLWLLLLPLWAGFGWWVWSRAGGLGAWDRAASPALLRAMTALGRIDVGTNRAPMIALLASLGISILALAGPAIERRDAQSFRNLDGVLFVVDTSSSVTEDARWPQMLTMGRFAVSALGTRPGGLIVFAGDAYVATDMTRDHQQIGQTFSLIDAKTVPDPGSRPARALARAAQLMADAEVLAGDVVLFTDGAGLGPETLREAAVLAGQGARLSLVSLGTPSAGMETHASVGGGQVFTLEQTDALQRWLASEARTRLERSDYPLLFWRDMGRYLLGLTLLPLLFLFRRDRA